VVLIFQTITKLVNFDVKYKQIFQEAGLLHMLINLLKQFHTQFQTDYALESSTDACTTATESRSLAPPPPITTSPAVSPALAIPRSKHARNISISSMLDLDENMSLSPTARVPKTLATTMSATTPGRPVDEEPMPKLVSYTVTADCITVLLDNVPENSRIFREAGCVQILFDLVCNRETRYVATPYDPMAASLPLHCRPLCDCLPVFCGSRPAALKIMLVLLQQDPVHLQEDLVGLLELLQNAPKNDYRMKQDILKTLKRCFIESARAKDAFRENGGFVCTVSLLVSLEESLLSPAQIEALSLDNTSLSLYRSSSTSILSASSGFVQRMPSEKIEKPFTELELDAKASLLVTIFRLMTAAITGHSKNRSFFREQIVCTLAGSLKLTGILPTTQAFKVGLSCLCLCLSLFARCLICSIACRCSVVCWMYRWRF
jgi:hypothetical protein